MANKYANGSKVGPSKSEICVSKPKKQTPQEVIRTAGYGDGFFAAAGSLGIKVDKAEITTGNFLRVIFIGAQGNGFKTTQSFPVINCEPVCPHEIIGKLRSVHSTISQHNSDIRVFKGTPKPEGMFAPPAP